MYGFRRPLKVRNSYARTKAFVFLSVMGVQAPPVPAKKLLKKISRLLHFNNALTNEASREEGFSCLIGGAYYVYINTDLPNGRDTFTYGHELGHIVLRHHEDFDIHNLTDQEHRILDREADVFATNLLMPEEWVNKFVQSPISVPEMGRIKNVFGVSWEAVVNRLDELRIHTKAESRRLFAEWRNRSRGMGFVSIDYRNIAAYRLEFNLCTSVPGEVVVLSGDPDVFEVAAMDENMRYLKCPNCDNEDFSPDVRFCKKCGEYLYNGCTNTENDPRSRFFSCGKNNVPDALYCEHCGAKTMLLEMMEKFGITAKKVIVMSRQVTESRLSVVNFDDDSPF